MLWQRRSEAHSAAEVWEEVTVTAWIAGPAVAAAAVTTIAAAWMTVVAGAEVRGAADQCPCHSNQTPC